MKPNTTIEKLLHSKVTHVSTNTLDKMLRIEVNGQWFIECDDPSKMFGSPEVHSLKEDHDQTT